MDRTDSDGPYGLWALRYGQNQIALSNVAALPYYIADSAGGTAASLTGLFRIPGTAPGAVTGFPPFSIEWGRPIAVVLAALLAWRLARSKRPEARTWALIALLLGFWISTGLVAGPGRSAEASRYQYPGVLIALLLAAEVFRGARVRGRAVALVAAALGFALIANVANLRDGARFLSEQAQVNRAELAAMELAKSRVPPAFTPEGPNSSAGCRTLPRVHRRPVVLLPRREVRFGCRLDPHAPQEP